jgi:PKD repeat protein
VVYIPDINYYDSDSFTFKASDGLIDSNVATISITVNPVNDAPVIGNYQTTTSEDNAVDVVLNATDTESDPLTFVVVNAPTHGTAQVNGNIVIYAPSVNYSGADSFGVAANDGTTNGNTGVVDVTVDPVNDAPVASFTANPTNGPLPLNVNFDATTSVDPDGNNLIYEWTFGDGETGSGPTVSHIYTAEGVFTAALKVADPNLLEDTSSTEINVTNPVFGAVAHYKLDEGAGSVVGDSSISGFDGIINGATWATGKFGSALLFDGVNDNVNLGNFNVTGNQMTISTWVYSNGYQDDDRIISKTTGTSESAHYWMVSLSSSRLRFRLRTGTQTKSLRTNVVFPMNQWVHVAAVYDGSRMRIYQNGIEVANTAKSGNIATSSAPVLLGANPNNYSVWNGRIDEMVIYNRALSTVEIQQLASQ